MIVVALRGRIEIENWSDSAYPSKPRRSFKLGRDYKKPWWNDSDCSALIVAWLEQEQTEESASRFLFAVESLVSELRSDFFTNRPERTWIRKRKDLCLRQSSETWLEHVVEVRSYFFTRQDTYHTYLVRGAPSRQLFMWQVELFTNRPNCPFSAACLYFSERTERGHEKMI